MDIDSLLVGKTAQIYLQKTITKEKKTHKKTRNIFKNQESNQGATLLFTHSNQNMFLKYILDNKIMSLFSIKT